MPNNKTHSKTAEEYLASGESTSNRSGREVRDESVHQAEDRSKRIPVSGARDLLTIPDQGEGYKSRFVNDKDGRINRFQRGGWEIIKEQGTLVGQRTVEGNGGPGPLTRPVGNGIWAIAMRIPIELWNEDQEAKEDELARTEMGILESEQAKLNSATGASGREGAYSETGIMETGRTLKQRVNR